MERWEGKVALVTGASSGIGAATVAALIRSGMIVVGMARRLSKLQELAENLPQGAAFFPIRGDVSKEEDIAEVFDFIKETLGNFHVLVNNAAIIKLGRILYEMPTDVLRDTMDINVMGVAMCCRHAFKTMTELDVGDGHIININSIAGHGVPDRDDPVMNIYPTSKNALTALTHTLRYELVALNSSIKITSISPGYTETELFVSKSEGQIEVSKFFHSKLKASKRPCLKAPDVAQAVLTVLATPPHVQITELTIKPVGEPI